MNRIEVYEGWESTVPVKEMGDLKEAFEKPEPVEEFVNPFIKDDTVTVNDRQLIPGRGKPFIVLRIIKDVYQQINGANSPLIRRGHAMVVGCFIEGAKEAYVVDCDYFEPFDLEKAQRKEAAV